MAKWSTPLSDPREGQWDDIYVVSTISQYSGGRHESAWLETPPLWSKGELKNMTAAMKGFVKLGISMTFWWPCSLLLSVNKYNRNSLIGHSVLGAPNVLTWVLADIVLLPFYRLGNGGREVKWLAQSHTARRQWRWELNPDSVALKLVLLTSAQGPQPPCRLDVVTQTVPGADTETSCAWVFSTFQDRVMPGFKVSLIQLKDLEYSHYIITQWGT